MRTFYKLTKRIDSKAGTAIRGVLAVSLFAIVGFYTLHYSQAASLVVKSEAETGALQGNAVNAADSAASGGLSVAFGGQSGQTDTVLHHILSTGQSLSLGAEGVPVLTTAQPYSNLTLTRNATLPPIYGYNNFFTPLVESQYESSGSSMANNITAAVPGNKYQIIYSHAGYGGYTYAQLKKGAVGADGISPYADGLEQIRVAKNAAASLNLSYGVTALDVIHGESDYYYKTTRQQYIQDLVEWQQNYATDINAITGRHDPIPMITDQLNTGYTTTPDMSISMAQLDASEQYPSKIILVGPKYFLPYSGIGPHLTNYGYQLLGEYHAKVYKKVIVDHQTWRPLSPNTITRSGTVITANFNVPVPPLRFKFDTTQYIKKDNYGFEYTDGSTSPPTIANVNITSPTTIQITLSAAPTGSNEHLSYAWSSPQGLPGSASAVAMHGNVQDSDATKAISGDVLPNWMVTFDKLVTKVN